MIKLEEFLEYEQPTKYIVNSTDYDDEYSIPVLTAGKSFILGYTNEKENVFPEEKLPVIIFDDFTTEFKYVDFPFKVKSSAMKILHPTSKCNLKYAYYLMKTLNIDTSTHKRYWISQYSQIEVEDVALNKQKEIADKLELIEKAIKNRQDTKEDFNQFLSDKFFELFGDPKENNNKFEVNTLASQISYVVDNRGKNPPSYAEKGVPIIDNFMINNNGIIDLSNSSRYISQEVRETFIRKELKPRDVLITLVGAGYGNLALTPNDDCVIIQNTVGLRTKDTITPEFIYYQLIYLRKVIQNMNTSAAQPSVKVGNLLNLNIVIPPLTEQNKFTNYVRKIEAHKLNLNKDIEDLNKLFNSVLNKLI